MHLLGHLDHLADRMGHLASRRLLLTSGAVSVVLAAVLFASSGRFSLAAVAQQCGEPAPDVRFTTSPDGVQEFLVTCGETGRAAYRDLQLVDLLYPAALGLFLAAALALVLPRAVPGAADRVRAFAVLPLMGAAFDYLENLAAWTLLLRHPASLPWVARILGTASAAKQTLMWASVLLLAAGLIGIVVVRLRSPRSPQTHAPGT
jgi:hypothetical protein